QLGASHVHKHVCSEMRGVADALTAIDQLAGVGLCVGDQLLDGIHRQPLAYHHQIGHRAEYGDRHKLLGLEGHFLVKALIGGERWARSWQWTATWRWLRATFPSKPVKFLIPYPGGGSNDVLARIVGEKLQAKWGQPVIIENRTGGSGNLAAAAVAQAEPDGRSAGALLPCSWSCGRQATSRSGYSCCSGR